MMFLHQKIFKKHYILLKTTFEIPLFLVEEDWEQAAAFNYYKYNVHISYRIKR